MNHWMKFVSTLLVLSLAACGGGGGGDSDAISLEPTITDELPTEETPTEEPPVEEPPAEEAPAEEPQVIFYQPPLNDTGVTGYFDLYSNDLVEAPPELSPQDADFGRDADAVAGTLVKVGAGAAGFDFTKIAADGTELDASATEWACVRDNVTGLTWEVKTADGGLRGVNQFYRLEELPNYLTQLNQEALCGRTDWRIPSDPTIATVFHHGVTWPALDTDYFPRIALFYPETDTVVPYWTSTRDVYDPNNLEMHSVAFFGLGQVGASGGYSFGVESERYPEDAIFVYKGVMAVAGGVAPPSSFTPAVANTAEGRERVQRCRDSIPPSAPNERYEIGAGGDTVIDTITGLEWMRCLVGQNWDGTTCVSPPVQNICSPGTDLSYLDCDLAPGFYLTNAFAYVQQLNAGDGFAGHTDWRIPNGKEALSTKEVACSEPWINTEIFKGAPDRCIWTSTPMAAGLYSGSGFMFSYCGGLGPSAKAHSESHPEEGYPALRLVRNAD